MLVAVSYSKFATSKSGGARESLLTLLDGVAERRDVSVDAYQTPPADDPPDTTFKYEVNVEDTVEIPKLTWTNQVFERYQWGRYLRKVLGEEHDIMVTQSRLAPVSVGVAEEKGIPSFFFVRSMALTGYEKYSPKRGHVSNLLRTDIGGRVQYPFLVKNFRQYSRAARDATRVLANSEFTAGKIEELFGVDAEVIYPPIEIEKYRTENDDDGYVTMVNPRTEYKGPDIFLDIADAMPEEEFLLVGPIGSADVKERAEETMNVTHWEWCDDMKDAYSASKVVVTPSRWEEPFGRVPAEAMVSGIPCVVSNRGGLPEVVGDTGEVVDDVESTDAWVSAVRRATENHRPEAQKERAERFSAERQVEKFGRMIDEIQGSAGQP
ncbi:MAG: glycosyltransferase family 4 protein [Halobacteriales archaeon]|nr:glycosyltransferase family 4 protein [Halobacteriales archaeon]